MYVCGVSSEFNWLATNVVESAGGVRTTVGEGIGISLGTGVAVGCSCANAVWKACVNATLISAVGTDPAWQEARRSVRNKKEEIRSGKLQYLLNPISQS